jgi:hypothetical protein
MRNTMLARQPAVSAIGMAARPSAGASKIFTDKPATGSPCG